MLAHLGKALVITQEFALGRSEIAGEELDPPSVDGRRGGQQAPAKLLEHDSSALIGLPGEVELPAHRVELAEHDESEALRAVVVG